MRPKAFVRAGEKIAHSRPGDPIQGCSTVEPSCGEQAGNWWCATHRHGVRNNMEQDAHDTAECRWAWFCREHGWEEA